MRNCLFIRIVITKQIKYHERVLLDILSNFTLLLDKNAFMCASAFYIIEFNQQVANL
jgi:hypothetical protein